MNQKNASDRIIYQLSIEDIQTVAKNAFGRPLIESEIEEIIETIEDSINWQEIIENAISYKLNLVPIEEDGDE